MIRLLEPDSGGIKIHPEQVESKISVIMDDLQLTNRFFITGRIDGTLGQRIILAIEGLPFDTSNLILVFNKVDRIENDSEFQQIKSQFENAVFISAQRHIGLNNLKKEIIAAFDNYYCEKEILLSFNKGFSEHMVHNFATILDKKYMDDSVCLKIKYHQTVRNEIHTHRG